MRTDNHLIRDYLEGDEHALGVLVDRYLKDVYTFAFSLTRDARAADDIAQESFIKAWKHIHSFIPGKSFKAWLFQIARTTALDALRKKKELAFSAFENAEGENMLTATLADTAPLPDELCAQAEDTAYVGALLERLDSRYRDVLTLRYTSDMTFEEIGSLLKRPLHTVKSQHRRAITALRRLLANPI